MIRTTRESFDYTNKDYDAFREMMITSLRQKMPEYTDLSESDAGIVLLELCAMGLDILSYYNDVAANEAFFSTLRQRTNAMKWCKIFGYTPLSARPSKFKQVFYLDKVRETSTLIPVGTLLKATQENEEVLFETAEDLIIPAGKLGNEQTIPSIYDVTVDVIQGVSIIQEVIGSSNGSANQFFQLNYYPAIEDSVILYVGSPTNYNEWEHVTTFMDSTPTSTHFMINYTGLGETQITFGDGVFGKIPEAGVNNIICSYRSGGGAEGNVGAHKINKLITSLPSVKTFNPYLAFELGTEAESLSSIKMKAPNSFRTLWGALTLSDFGDTVVNNFPEVSDAVCIVGSVEDELNMYIIMESGYELTPAYIQDITDFFDENEGGRKIVGVTNINLLPPTEVKVDIRANLMLEPFYDRMSVENSIREYAHSYFEEGATAFNDYFPLNQLMRDILTPSISGLRGIRSFSFQSVTAIDGANPSDSFQITTDTINLGKGELVNLNELIITII